MGVQAALEKGLVYRGFKVSLHDVPTCNERFPTSVSGSRPVCSTTSGLSVQAFLSSSCHMQVMPYSTGLSTPLANFEANQNYKDTVDPSVMVSPT